MIEQRHHTGRAQITGISPRPRLIPVEFQKSLSRCKSVVVQLSSLGIIQMRTLALILLGPFLTGCATSTTSDFVQGRIKIIPPVHRVGDCSVYSDGGTTMCVVQDAAGNLFNIYYDHRIHTQAPGAIYLLAHPNERGSVRVQNEAAFRSKVRYE